MTRLWVAVAVVAAAPAMSAATAQTPAVDSARQAGIVGERYDGFVGFAAAPSVALRGQVGAINIRRRSLYSRFAASRGVAPQEVGITAGCQMLARVQVGQAYMLIDGRWRRRLPGQMAPIPDYCR